MLIPRNHYNNVYQLKFGRSTEINYLQSKFPLLFFLKIFEKDINVIFAL